MEDLTGQIFGNLQVITYNETESAIRSNKYHHAKHCWTCQCIKCGNKSVKLNSDLKQIAKKGLAGCKECNRVNLIGQRFGRLVVIGLAEQQEIGKQMWLCQCDCGNTCVHQTGDLRKKNPVQSCGCLHSELLSQRNRESGIRGGDSKNPEYERLYHIWNAMRHRCNSENDMNYHLYGGRGITVCKEWEENWFTFKDWALANGYQDDLSIDRINVNGNYEPNNCRWVTQQVQSNNTRVNKYLDYHGETDTLANWCRRLNLDYYRTKARLNTCGYSVEEAFELGKYELRTT